MSKLQLSVAIGNYDRVRPLMDGAVQIDGVDPVFMNLPPEEIFFRAFRSQDFDICELSMSSFTVKTADRNCPYVGMPAFVSRAFRHNSIYVRKDRIKIAGRSQGPARRPAGISAHRLRLGPHHPGGRSWREAVRRDLGEGRDRRSAAGRRRSRSSCRPACGMEDAPEGTTISAAAGARRDRRLHRAARAEPRRQERIRISAGCSPIRSPPGKDYFQRTGIFPIMHVTGIRRTLVEKHPWLPAAVFKAFSTVQRRSAWRRWRTPRPPR